VKQGIRRALRFLFLFLLFFVCPAHYAQHRITYDAVSSVADQTVIVSCLFFVGTPREKRCACLSRRGGEDGGDDNGLFDYR